MIDINDITIRIGQRILLDHASVHIGDSQKVGIVGLNGCGKSTLFRVLRNEIDIESGIISFPNKACVVSVNQELTDTHSSVLDYILSQDKQLTSLKKALNTASDIEKPELLEQWRLLDYDAAPAKASRILYGLGFSETDLSRFVGEFSGGWRMRLMLAAALFQPSTILLLDEPTNHLDLESTIWLLNHLKKYLGTLLLISHDRIVLNELCDHIVHFDNQKLTLYKGNYDSFQKMYASQIDILTKQIVKQTQKREHLQSFIDRFRYKATKARQAQSRLKQLSKMADLPELPKQSESHFTFPKPARLAPPLLILDHVSVGYNNEPVLKNLSFSIGPYDRIALIGENGNGKSTLAKLLAGRLQSLEGSFCRSPKLQIGYFSQHQTEELPIAFTPLLFMSRLLPSETETKIRKHLAHFGLTGDRALTRIEYLSGGEKARLLFARMTINEPALLILDEPTNHLDIQGREALVEALNSYHGGVILITHDLNLLELTADQLWLVKDGTCKYFDGDIDDYRSLLLLSENKDVSTKKNIPSKTLSRVKKVHSSAEVRQTKAKMGLLEKELDTLTNQKKSIEESFMKPLTPTQIREATDTLRQLEAQISDIEEKWLALSDKIT